MSEPYRIVFVCLGNICRSPTAEVVFRSMLEQEGLADRVALASAGTGNWHVGSGIDGRAGAELRRTGYDGTQHRARQFDSSWFADHDLVVAMDSANRSSLEEVAPSESAREKIRMLRSYDAQAAASGDLDVPDPYYEDNFASVLGIIERACRGLLDEVKERLSG